MKHTITLKLKNETHITELLFKHDHFAHQCLEWLVKAENLEEIRYVKGQEDDD
jgi:hypothetical protein